MSFFSHRETHFNWSRCQFVDQHIFIDFPGIVGKENTYVASPSVSYKNPFISPSDSDIENSTDIGITKVIGSLTLLSFNKCLMCV